MLFQDQDLRLNILNTQSGSLLSFKAYLEDSDITYEVKDQQLPFVPTSFTNDSMALRVTEKAKFTFNVFSETRQECVENYINLNKLITSIKPSYSYVFDQISPYLSNVVGYFNINFKGFPDGRDNILLHLNSFSYNINKDLGYIHVPVSEINGNIPSYYDSTGMKLIPIGYKISLEGKILLEFDKTANVFGQPSTDPDISAGVSREQQQQQTQVQADQRTEQEKKRDQVIAGAQAVVDTLVNNGFAKKLSSGGYKYTAAIEQNKKAQTQYNVLQQYQQNFAKLGLK